MFISNLLIYTLFLYLERILLFSVKYVQLNYPIILDNTLMIYILYVIYLSLSSSNRPLETSATLFSNKFLDLPRLKSLYSINYSHFDWNSMLVFPNIDLCRNAGVVSSIWKKRVQILRRNLERDFSVWPVLI